MFFEFANKEVQKSYDWSVKSFAEEDYIHDKHLNILEVLQAHYLIVDMFFELGEGIGGVGVKDVNMLCSALSRQNTCFGSVCKYKTVFDIAASILYALVKNHPFYDANKRTAFLSILYYLQKHNYTPSVSQKDFEDFLVEVASDKIKQKSRYKELVKKSDSPEVDYISWYLKANTRKLDKREYLVTYRELRKILQSFNFDLKYPSNNAIAVISYRKRILSRDKFKEVKIGTIAFPGDSKQVSKPDIRKVREITGLTSKNGFDSQVFYKELSPLSVLLVKYQGPLKRLANR